MLVMRKGTKNIWHRLLELWVAKTSLDVLNLSDYLTKLALEDVKYFSGRYTRTMGQDTLASGNRQETALYLTAK